MIWFTADTHFHHSNIIRYCNRPYANADEMNAALIQNWNDRVGPEDTVYHLGDFLLSRKDSPQKFVELIRKLNGRQINVLPGNHDHFCLQGVVGDRFQVYSCPLLYLREAPGIVLCHFAMRTWPRSNHGSWHLYGHSHGQLPEDANSLSFDIGVDCNGYAPIGLDEVTEKMKKKLQEMA